MTASKQDLSSTSPEEMNLSGFRLVVNQNNKFRELLKASLSILESKHVIVLSKDDEFNDVVDKYKSRLKEYGIE